MELTKINVLNLLLLLGVSQGLIVCTILLFKKPPKLYNRILALWIAAMALSNTNIILISSNLSRVFGQWSVLMIPLSFELFYGPLIYLFILSIEEPKFKFSKRHILHLLPGIVEFIYYLSIYLRPLNFKQNYYGEVHWAIVEPTIEVFSFASFTIYLFLTFNKLTRLKSKMESQFSISNLETFGWLKRLLLVLCILAGIWGVLTVIDVFVMNYTLAFIYFYPYYLLIVFLSYYIGFSWLQRTHTSLFLFPQQNEDAKESLDMTELNELSEKLTDLLLNELLFLDPNLNARYISDRLNISAQTLSRVFNTGLGDSFHSHINQLRVEHVKSRLKSEDLNHMTIAGIAKESGFNSDSSFYRIFKKYTGKTPKAYIETNEK